MMSEKEEARWRYRHGTGVDQSWGRKGGGARGSGAVRVQCARILKNFRGNGAAKHEVAHGGNVRPSGLQMKEKAWEKGENRT